MTYLSDYMQKITPELSSLIKKDALIQETEKHDIEFQMIEEQFSKKSALGT